MCKQMKHQEGLLPSITFTFIVLANPQFVFSQASDSSCILDFHISSSTKNESNCERGNWGGFINKNCCADVFGEYLYALAKQANRTGNIFLNSIEQGNCLMSVESVAKNVSGCGIEKLNRGATACSSYNKVDVVTKLGDGLKFLDEDCKFMDSDEKFDQVCGTCLRRWEEIGGSSNNGTASNFEANLCRFAVLVTLTSNLIDNKKWVQAVYKCLAMQNISVENEQEGTSSSHVELSTGMLILIIGLVGIATIIFITAWIILRKSTPENLSTEKNDESYSEQYSSLKISIKEIYSATNNLNVLNFIGQGIAGKVYKGILPNGQHIAVKHIIDDGYAETFVREVTSLSHVRHPNLVALLGFCKNKDECFLVYELCQNGNLSEWLYSKDRTLSWIKRLQIAIDSARGLWFLHTYPGGCIVHRDIKPTNILINADFQAKLSDFGLSKVMDVGQSYVSSEVRGTFGYVDPEYQRNHRVNAKGDVYSFGMVLLQLLSGKRVINLNLNRAMQINKIARCLARGGNVTEFADPKLNGEYSVEAFDLVLELALSCTGHKQERPSMEQVVLRLNRALDIS